MDLIKNCLFIKIISFSNGLYNKLCEQIFTLFKMSFLFKVLNDSLELARVLFFNSFLGKITQRDEFSKFDFINNSLFLDWIKKKKLLFLELLFNYSNNSFFIPRLKEIFKKIFSTPLKFFSLFIITFVSINLTATFFLSQEFNFWSLFLKLLFIFFGIGFYFIKTNINVLLDNSIFLQNLKKD